MTNYLLELKKAANIIGFFTGPVKTTNTTASTNPTTGSGIFGGGIGVNGAGNFSGIIQTTNTTASNDINNGSGLFAGGIGVTGAGNFGGVLKTFSTLASTSPTTGSGVFGGGIGVVGAGNFGGVIKTTDTTATTSILTGSIVGGGGIAAAGNIYAGGNIVIPSSAWNAGMLVLGSTYFWVDSGAGLRAKSNATPTSANDGTLIGPYTATSLPSTATANVSATNVQAAIAELDLEKAGLGLANLFTAIQEITNTTSATSTTTGAFKLPGIGMGNGNIYLSTPPTTDNNQKAATTAFVNNYISRGSDSNSIPYIRFGNSSGSGLLIKFLSSVVTISGNTATINYSGTPAFSTVNLVLLCNGDSGASDSSAHIASWNATQFVVRTPTFTAGPYRVNWMAIGVPA